MATRINLVLPGILCAFDYLYDNTDDKDAFKILSNDSKEHYFTCYGFTFVPILLKTLSHANNACKVKK